MCLTCRCGWCGRPDQPGRARKHRFTRVHIHVIRTNSNRRVCSARTYVVVSATRPACRGGFIRFEIQTHSLVDAIPTDPPLSNRLSSRRSLPATHTHVALSPQQAARRGGTFLFPPFRRSRSQTHAAHSTANRTFAQSQPRCRVGYWRK
jgi:hypothetical protein